MDRGLRILSESVLTSPSKIRPNSDLDQTQLEENGESPATLWGAGRRSATVATRSGAGAWLLEGSRGRARKKDSGRRKFTSSFSLHGHEQEEHNTFAAVTLQQPPTFNSYLLATTWALIFIHHQFTKITKLVNGN